MDSWIAKKNIPCIFISAKNKTNIAKLRSDIYKMTVEVQSGKYPFDNFLW
jgi:GTP-binding protein HflX